MTKYYLKQLEEYPTNELILQMDNDYDLYHMVYDTVKSDIKNFNSYPELEDLIEELSIYDDDNNTYSFGSTTFSSREFYNINYNYVLKHIKDSLKSW
tara:strand:+ start:266 stop:556 length:291 start_codon:yes stop_codon:yes gene_type:complete